MLWNIPNRLAYIHIICSSRYLNRKSTKIRTIFNLERQKAGWMKNTTKKNIADPFRKMSYDNKSKTFFIHFLANVFLFLIIYVAQCNIYFKYR